MGSQEPYVCLYGPENEADLGLLAQTLQDFYHDVDLDGCMDFVGQFHSEFSVLSADDASRSGTADAGAPWAGMAQGAQATHLFCLDNPEYSQFRLDDQADEFENDFPLDIGIVLTDGNSSLPVSVDTSNNCLTPTPYSQCSPWYKAELSTMGPAGEPFLEHDLDPALLETLRPSEPVAQQVTPVISPQTRTKRPRKRGREGEGEEAPRKKSKYEDRLEEKPEKCPFCGHGWQFNRDKERHMVSCDETRAAEMGLDVSRKQCSHCPRSYKRKDGLKRHMRDKHPKILLRLACAVPTLPE